MLASMLLTSLLGPVAAARLETLPTSIERPTTVRHTAVRVALDRRAIIISDSAMAGIRWNGALDGFRGFRADDRLESCRRLVARSCYGREQRRPPTALIEIAQLTWPGPNDVLVIATGYNDVATDFADDARLVLDVAVARGFDTIAWVTYREDVDYEFPGADGKERSDYAEMNDELDKIIADGDYPQLQLWDLDDYTTPTPDTWFYDDGVHERVLGSWAIADWISRKMAHISELPCPMAWGPNSARAPTCPDPNELRREVGYPDLAALYDL